MTDRVDVIEFTDPGCAWSWGAEPTLRWLAHRYDGHLRWRRVFGVQLDGSGSPAARVPERPQEVLARWLEVAAHTGAPVTAHLEWAHVTTRPAALAAKAAERQGPVVGERALRRLRQAFFVAGRPPDTPERIADALAGVRGLDIDGLVRALADADVMAALADDWAETRRPHPEVVGLREPAPHPGGAKLEADGSTRRYGFPTLLVRGPAGEQVVPGWRSPRVYREAVEAVAPGLASIEPRRLSADEALDRYGSLTPRDLVLLTGAGDTPSEAVPLRTATTTLWLAPDEAEHLAGVQLQGVLG